MKSKAQMSKPCFGICHLDFGFTPLEIKQIRFKHTISNGVYFVLWILSFVIEPEKGNSYSMNLAPFGRTRLWRELFLHPPFFIFSHTKPQRTQRKDRWMIKRYADQKIRISVGRISENQGISGKSKMLSLTTSIINLIFWCPDTLPTDLLITWYTFYRALPLSAWRSATKDAIVLEGVLRPTVNDKCQSSNDKIMTKLKIQNRRQNANVKNHVFCFSLTSYFLSFVIWIYFVIWILLFVIKYALRPRTQCPHGA